MSEKGGAACECPSRQVLLEFVQGSLETELLETVADHIGRCPQCEATVQDLESHADPLIAALRTPLEAPAFEQEPAFQQGLAAAERWSAQWCTAAQPALAAAGRGGGGESPTVSEGRYADAIQAGTSLGQYAILERLGQGGMGDVYKALHTRLGKVVALKILPPHRLRDAQAVARFEREMKAVGRLNHPHIVQALDAGEADGTHYLVMEYVEGCNLSRLSQQLGPLPIADACEAVRQAAVGLQFAHEHGLVHRDVKPSNLMLTPGGMVKVLDLGLARLLDLEDDRGLTSAGQIMGTLDYMAPEQVDDSHQVDARADVYALGATLYKLLTGHSVYHGQPFQTSMQKLRALATQPAPLIQSRRAEVPEELAAIVHRMLAKDPNDRMASAAQVAEALAPFAAGAHLAGLAARLSKPEPAPVEQSEKKTREEARSASVDTHAHTPALKPNPLADTVTLAASSEQGTSGPAAVSSAQAGFRRTGLRRRLAVALAAAAALLLAAVVFYMQTNHGTLVVEIDDPEGMLSVSVVGQDLVITEQGKPDQPIKISAGEHELRVTRGDLSFTSEAFTVRRGERVVLSVKRLPGEIRVVRKEAAGERLLGQHALPLPAVAGAQEPPAAEAIPTWQPTAEQQQFLDAVALLPQQQQIESVTSRLRQANPGYKVTLEPQFAEGGGQAGPVRHLRLVHGWDWPLPVDFHASFDYWPLAALRELASLDAPLAPGAHLAPLCTLPLEQVSSVAITPFHALAPELVAALPRLKSINGVSPEVWLARKQEVADLRRVLPALPPQEQLRRVVAKLVEYNPGYDGTVTNQTLTGTAVEGIWIENQPLLIDLSPLAALSGLKSLSCAYTSVSDLSPLAGMPLTSLHCGNTRVSDLSPLEGMPLTALNCAYTRVSDLSPLAGMPLTALNCAYTRVSDLSPLAGMPLTYLDCGYTPVSDLSPLAGMPLQELGCYNTLVSDLSPLKGMMLKGLTCHMTSISDLSPLQGMRLTYLQCGQTPISDLSPLAGMPLTYLNCLWTRVSDLSLLKALPLEQLCFDVRLFDEPLETLLRSLPLKQIRRYDGVLLEPADFWREVEARREAALAFATETAKLPVDEQISAVEARLKQINSNSVGPMGRVIEQEAVVEVTLVLEWGGYDLTPLMAFRDLKKLTLTGGHYYQDISCLGLLPLEELTCSDDIAQKNAATLKAMNSLRRINGQPAADYWNRQ